MNTLGDEIVTLRGRLHALEQQSDFESFVRSDPRVPEMFTSLGNALEELSVSNEELRVQQDELAGSRDQLEAERRRYQALFDFAPDAYIVTNEDGVIREANRAAGSLLGILPERLIDRPLVVFVPIEHRKDFRTNLARIHV